MGKRTLFLILMAYALVTSVAAGSTDGANVTTSGVDTSGSTLLVAFLASESGASAGTVSDSKINTWTAITAHPGATRRGQWFYCVPTSVGSSHTFTGASTNPTIVVYAFSGAAASPLGQSAGANGAAVTSAQPGSITPAENNEVVVCGICRNATNSAVPTVDSSMSTPLGAAGVAAQHANGYAAYIIQTTAGAINPTWSWVGSASYDAEIVSFKASSSNIPAAAHHRRLMSA